MRVLALSSSEEPQQVIDAIKAGAAGYLLKSATAAELADAVGRIHRGEAVLPSSLADIVLGEFRRDDSRGARTRAVPPVVPGDVQRGVDRLTPRERDVLTLIAEGRSNRAIGDRLFIGQKRVEACVRSIYSKLGLEPVPDDHRRVLAVLAFLR